MELGNIFSIEPPYCISVFSGGDSLTLVGILLGPYQDFQ